LTQAQNNVKPQAGLLTFLQQEKQAMDEKTPIILDEETAIALAEIVFIVGGFKEQIFAALSRSRQEAIETQVKATLAGRLAISRTNKDFLGEIAAMLAECFKKIAPAQEKVTLPDTVNEPAAGSYAELSDVLGGIKKPDILAFARMIALDVLIGGLNANVSYSVVANRRGEVKETVAKMKLGAVDQPICVTMNLTLVVIENIIASLETAMTHIGVQGKEIELAAQVQFARALSSGCRRKCSARVNAYKEGEELVGEAICFDVKEAAKAAYEALLNEACGDYAAYRKRMLDAILPMAIDVRAYLEEDRVRRLAEAVGTV
jgi:hypothetical protein